METSTNEDIEIEDTFAHDESDIKDENDDPSLHYEENFWPKEDEDPSGYTFKSKRKVFSKAVENLKIAFKKGAQKQIKNIGVKTLDFRTIKNMSEIDIELTKSDERGIACVKIYGPSKKGCTIMVTKSKKHDAKFVRILAAEVFKPLVNSFISGEGWNDILVNGASKTKHKQFVCKSCMSSFVTEKNLKVHEERYHEKDASKDQKIECKICEISFTTETLMKNHEEKVHRTQAPKFTEFNCESCKKAFISEINLKKHIKESHEDVKNKVDNVYQSPMDIDEVELQVLPPNVTYLPSNVNHIVNAGDLMYVTSSDGACAANTAAAHIFQDPEYGPQFRLRMNNHIVDNWEFYQEKISFPYNRKIGVQGCSVSFNDGEELKFKDFLKSSKSAYLWCDSEDLQVVANLYQMSIKVITIKDDTDENPSINHIGPDSALTASRILPAGIVPNMVLLHYKNVHYNLVISSDSNLAKYGSITNQLKNGDQQSNTVNDVTKHTLFKDNLEEKIASLTTELEQSHSTIRKLESTIEVLKDKLQHNINSITVPNEVIEDDQLTDDQYVCNDCSFQTNTEDQLQKHLVLKHHNISEASAPIKTFQCHSCGKNFYSKPMLMDHRKKDHKDIIAKCRRYQKNECAYIDEICWYSHSQQTPGSVNLNVKFECKYCKKTFESKSDLMRHLKTKHPQIKLNCREFARGSCKFSEQECWYRHTKDVNVAVDVEDVNVAVENVKNVAVEVVESLKDVNGTEICTQSEKDISDSSKPAHFVNENQVFHKDMQNLHPPEQMQKLMCLVEQLLSKVNKMEAMQLAK